MTTHSLAVATDSHPSTPGAPAPRRRVMRDAVTTTTIPPTQRLSTPLPTGRRAARTSPRSVPRLRTVSVGERTKIERHRVLASGAQTKADARPTGTQT